MKNKPNGGIYVCQKMLCIMKITIFLLLFSVLQISAKSYAQVQRISVDVKNGTFYDVVSQIEKQSEFRFFYENTEINNHSNVNLKVKNKLVQEVLDELAENNGISYEISGNHIVIQKSKSTNQQIAAQQISGMVTDEAGDGLIGVTVMEKGSQNATMTNVEGKYTIQLKGDKGILVFSYMGYKTVEKTISSTQKTIDVVLTEDAQILDEVVVVGYGTQKKVNLTGAVAMTEGDVLENRAISNIGQGLQGVIPNLNINFDSGKPDASTTFNIRGATSVNGGSALILVDGVETNDASLLNPQDIQSVSVLKDAASAAIYGARAAFGVVLITTKSGTLNQKTRVTYNNNISWSNVSRLPNGIASNKWMRAMNQANINNGGGAYFSDEQINAIDGFINDPINNPSAFVDPSGAYTAKRQWAYAGNTDWFDELYKSNAMMQQHNASITGGTDKNTYYASLGYKNQDGVLAYGTDKYERLNVALNFTTKVHKMLELGFKVKYNKNKTNMPNTQFYMGSSPYYEVYRAFPHIPIYLPDGNYAGIEGSNFNYNIAGILDEAGRSTLRADDVWLTGNFVFTPLKDLAIKGDITQNLFFKSTRDHQKTLYQTMPDPSQTPLTKGSPNGVKQERYNTNYQAVNVWADWNKSFGDHNLQAIVGYNQESKKIAKLEVESTGLFANNFPINNLAKVYKNISEDGTTVWAVQGGFFRLNYNYMSKYLLEVNGRYDGSSKYMSGDRWGFFPSVSGAWRVSEEKFFEPIKPVFEYVKLRASIGSLGNQVTDGNFQYLGYLQGTTLDYVMQDNILSGLKPSTLASTNITWEKVLTSNFGLDFSLLNNRLSASFDYYIRSTKDMVVGKAYPGVLGTAGGKENLAAMRTNGWELSLTWHDKINNVGGSALDYSLGVGLADNKSKITKFDNPSGSLANLYVGKELGEIWGYVTDGFIMDKAEADLMADRQSFISGIWLPGDIRYADLDGDGKIDKGSNTVSDPGDQKVIGNTTPRYTFNMNASVGWKGFDLRVFFQGVGKRDIAFGPSNNVFWGYNGMWHSSVNDYHVDNSWTETNTNAYYPIATWSERSKQVQTKYLQNGAYIRLKDVTLSYTIPKKLTTRIGLDELKVYVSGQNLWETTKLYKYIDPDALSKRTNKGDLNSDGKIYPFTRSYSFGVNLTF